MTTTRYPDIEVQLTGNDGNAMSIMTRVSRALRIAGVSDKEVNEYMAEAMSGDYDNVIYTSMQWVDVQ